MERIKIIAEIGVNHNGDLSLAMKLVEAAAWAGADIVKFQTFEPSKLVTPTAQKAKYQENNSPNSVGQHQMLQELQLSESDFCELKQFCEDLNVEFMSTAFDVSSLNFLLDLGMNHIKVASGELTNYPFLKEVSQRQKKVILSTGMADYNEIGWALDVLTKYELSKKQITLLHCCTEYPTPLERANVRVVKTLSDSFSVNSGLSDHTEGIAASLAAVSLGATIIEKHLTLDRSYIGPDHSASIEPKEFKQMVNLIRQIETSLGLAQKEMSSIELQNREASRRSIVASKMINPGDVFSENNLTTKRPGSGLSPMLWEELIGTKATKHFEQDEMITL